MRHVPPQLRLRSVAALSIAATIGLSAISWAATTSSANLIPNASFETSTTGWHGWNAEVKRIILSAHAPDGQYLAQVTRSTGTAYSIDNWPGLTSITAGTTYTATAYAAAGSSSAVGKPVQLVVREHTVGGTTVAQGKSSSVLLGTSTSFTKLSASVTARTTGDDLDVYLGQSSATSGDILLADDFVLTTPTPSPSGAVWAWDATTATVDPNSSALISSWQTGGSSYMGATMYMSTSSYGVATADTTPSSPCYNVPIRDDGTVDPTVCIPLGTQPDPSADGHLTVIDTIHDRETDFWQAHYDSTTQEISGASQGSSFPLGAAAERAALCSTYQEGGSDAACFPLSEGIVTPQDIASGAINHPLVFSTPQIGGTSSSSYRYPATHDTPTGAASHMVEGTWLRLPASVNCASTAYGVGGTAPMAGWEQMICVALKKYGMFLRDEGGVTFIVGETRINQGGIADWNAVGLPGSWDSEYGSVWFDSTFPWSHLQVLNPPASS
jgi:hypothetical protein